ncbi:hypothetical protein ABZ687_29130 [Streptomyces ardesiacus]|uniref:hypothetical protein n=1 Tax=Streptomyces ardesiacus TaxID=285564 RepID=UPI003401383C
MSDPAPNPACSSCPAALEPAELISNCSSCRMRPHEWVLLVLVSLNLIVTCVFGVLSIVRDDTATSPAPKPSPTSTPTPGDPEPSSPPTGGGETPTSAPTGPGETPSDPRGSGGTEGSDGG